jgi:hypothetical protein
VVNIANRVFSRAFMPNPPSFRIGEALSLGIHLVLAWASQSAMNTQATPVARMPKGRTMGSGGTGTHGPEAMHAARS